MLEDDTGKQCMAHRAHRVVTARVSAHHLKVLPQALVGEMIEHQLEPIEVESDKAKAKASYKQGVLRVEMPKDKARRRQPIKVSVH
jgi:hypothetical protein